MDQNLVRSLFTETFVDFGRRDREHQSKISDSDTQRSGANTMNLIDVTSKLATDEPLRSRTHGQIVAGSRGHGQSLQLQAHDSYKQEA